MKLNFLTLICFLLSNIVCSQNVNDVLTKMNAVLTNRKCLQFNTKYDFYKSHDSKVKYQTYTGFFKKTIDNEIFMKINNTDFFNTTNYSIKINHDQKAMIVDKANKFDNSTFDVNKLLVYCDVDSFKDKKTYWEINLVSKKYSSLNYSRIVLLVNKDFTFNKQVFYYNTNLDFAKSRNKQDQSKPRLEIEYSSYNNFELKKEIFNLNNFYSINAGKIIAASKYTGYQIIDKRIKNKI